MSSFKNSLLKCLFFCLISNLCHFTSSLAYPWLLFFCSQNIIIGSECTIILKGFNVHCLTVWRKFVAISLLPSEYSSVQFTWLLSLGQINKPSPSLFYFSILQSARAFLRLFTLTWIQRVASNHLTKILLIFLKNEKFLRVSLIFLLNFFFLNEIANLGQIYFNIGVK